MPVLDLGGTLLFTGHYDIRLIPHQTGTKLNLDLRVTHSTIEAAPLIAGIPLGWAQVLDLLASAVERSLQIQPKDGRP